MNIGDSILQDLLAVGILLTFGLLIYSRTTGKSLKDILTEVKKLNEI